MCFSVLLGGGLGVIVESDLVVSLVLLLLEREDMRPFDLDFDDFCDADEDDEVVDCDLDLVDFDLDDDFDLDRELGDDREFDLADADLDDVRYFDFDDFDFDLVLDLDAGRDDSRFLSLPLGG